MENITKMIFIDFLTQPQYVNIRGENTIQDYINHMISFLEQTEMYSAFFDEGVLWITEKNTYSNIILRVIIDSEDNTFHIETGSDEGIDVTNDETLKEVGACALYLLNAHTEWETDVGLIPYDTDKYKEISLAISNTTIMLNPEEQSVIYDLLHKIAVAHGFDYDLIENKNFEIEIRGLYPLDGPIQMETIQDVMQSIVEYEEDSQESEEDSSSIDEWI